MKTSSFKKSAILAALKKLKVDPVSELVTLARDETIDPRTLAVRAKVWAELMQYCYPKLRAVEVNIQDMPKLPVQLSFDWQSLLRPPGGDA